MKILFLTAAGEMLGLAERIARTHDVKAFVAGGVISQLAGIGRVERVASWRPEMKWADLIVADYPMTPAEQTILRERGRLLLGVGTVGLEELITADPKPGLPFSLIEFWNGHTHIGPSFWGTNQKRQLAGDLGPDIATLMSACVWRVSSISEEVMNVIRPAKGILSKSDYRGPVVYDFEMTDGAVQIVNISARPLMMYLAPIFGLINEDPMEFLTRIAGGAGGSFAYHDQVGVSTRLYGPPWPYRMEPGMTVPDPIFIDEKVKKYIWLTDVVDQVLSEDNKEYHNFYFGASGSIGIAATIGRKGSRPKDHFREAQRRLDKVVAGIYHSVLQFRSDAGGSIKNDYKTLRLRGIE